MLQLIQNTPFVPNLVECVEEARLEAVRLAAAQKREWSRRKGVLERGSPEHRALMSAIQKARPAPTPERAAASAAMTPEVRARLSAAVKAGLRPLSAEQRFQRSAAMKVNPKCLAANAAQRGKIQPLEFVAKRVEAIAHARARLKTLETFTPITQKQHLALEEKQQVEGRDRALLSRNRASEREMQREFGFSQDLVQFCSKCRSMKGHCVKESGEVDGWCRDCRILYSRGRVKVHNDGSPARKLRWKAARWDPMGRAFMIFVYSIDAELLRCFWDGKPCTKERGLRQRTIEHMHCLAGANPSHEFWNLQVAHHSANSRKSYASPEEFALRLGPDFVGDMSAKLMFWRTIEVLLYLQERP